MGIAVQLSIIEPYGIMIIRFEKEISSIYSSSNTSSSGSGGKIYVFRTRIKITYKSRQRWQFQALILFLITEPDFSFVNYDCFFMKPRIPMIRIEI